MSKLLVVTYGEKTIGISKEGITIYLPIQDLLDSNLAELLNSIKKRKREKK